MLARLGRITSSGRFIPEIDGLRFMAIFVVIIFHAKGHFFAESPSPWAGGLESLAFMFSCGWFGVQLFFIISGFILATPFAEHYLLDKPKISLKKYFLRRVTRLEPPYIVNLAILFTMLMVWKGFRWPDERQAMSFMQYLPHFLASVFYAHNAIYQDMSFINHVAWTLEIEVQFYILAPLLCVVFAVRNLWLRRLIVAAAIMASAWQSNYYFSDAMNRTIAGQLRYFLLGLLLADFYILEWKGKPAKTFIWDAIGLTAWATIPFLLADWRAYEGTMDWLGRSRNFLLPGVLLLAYVAAFRGRVVNKFFSFSWIAAFGGMCYSIYLYHVTVMWLLLLGDVGEYNFFPPGLRHVIEWVIGPLPESRGALNYDWLNFVQIIGMAVVVMVLCIPMFLIFEKPFMRKDWPARARQKFAPLLAWIFGTAGRDRESLPPHTASLPARTIVPPTPMPGVIPVKSNLPKKKDPA